MCTASIKLVLKGLLSADVQSEFFHKICLKLDVKESALGQWLEVTEDYQDAVYEMVYKIKAAQETGAKLFKAIEFFNTNARKVWNFPATISIDSPELYEQKLVCTLPSIYVDKVMFGNIHDNRLYNHWQVSFDSSASQTTNPYPPLDQLNVRLEFDKPQPIIVDFFKRTYRFKKGGVVEKTKIELGGDSIQKLIVDFSSEDDTTRLYFVLRYPPKIYTSCLNENGKEYEYKRSFQLDWGNGKELHSNEQVLTENSVFCIDFGKVLDAATVYTIVSRLYHRFRINVQFSSIHSTLDIIETKTTTHYFNEKNDAFTRFLELFSLQDGKTMRIDGIEKNERQFTYVYLIEALLSRGSLVKDQLLLAEKGKKCQWPQFLQIIKDHYHDDPCHFLCEAALEDLITYVDLNPSNVGNLVKIFEQLCEARKQSQVSNQISEEEWEEGYRKVRKTVLTPTRKLLLIPETRMGNRAMAGVDHDGTRVITTVFRDDNGQQMRCNGAQKPLKLSIEKWLREGFTVSDRDFGFLGCSNSQMREGGCYFMERYSKKTKEEYIKKNRQSPPFSFKPKILEYRERLGKFNELKSIPLVVSRLGQCFTQAKVCKNVRIGKNDYEVIPDVIGGDNGKYIFTDGIGKVSLDMARRIAQSVGLPKNCVPSAFQIRFRGFKGMLAVDPTLKTHHIIFRDSQLKFEDSHNNQTDWQIELVKYATPSPLTLNRPFINILDQVSASQSLECHQRVVARIEELLDSQMEQYENCITCEDTCRKILAEMPRRIHFPSLTAIQLTTDPFFRAVIKSYMLAGMIRLASKTQIQVPACLGRIMFGVTDDTGKLKHGQVFVCFTDNINTKHPSVKAKTSIVQGEVMVTKFPCTVKGDVRMLRAVDVPELHHMKDVIVFPQTGPRPHPDEMAGSDLDGDEYAVIWDKDLYLERNEKASVYCSDKPAKAFDKDEMDAEMHKCIADYMEKENVGSIATHHLLQSDQFGLDSSVCQTLAKKLSQALDFPKSGVAPSRPSMFWTYKDAPELAERHPDYWGSPFTPLPMYSSTRLLGRLFRKLNVMKDVIESSVASPIEVVPDKTLVWEGWKKYQLSAELSMRKYNSKKRSLMDRYGIKSDAELFSGCYGDLRCRVSDREADSREMFNTEKIIARQDKQIFREEREKFFEEFRVPGTHPNEKAFMKLTKPIDYNDIDKLQDDVLKRICLSPTDEMKAKATAYYQVCYSGSDASKHNLSFAWIAYDILNKVKKDAGCGNDFPIVSPLNGLSEKFISENKKKYDEFNNRMPKTESEEKVAEELKIYGTKCLFIIEQWADAVGLSQDDKSIYAHLLLSTVEDRYGYVLCRTVEMNPTVFLDSNVVWFFRNLSSFDFLTKDPKPVCEKLMLQFHKAAVSTYYNLVLNSRFAELPLSSESGKQSIIKDGIPFVIDLPQGTSIESIITQLERASKCVEIQARLERKMPKCDRFLVSSRGTIVANNYLRQLVAVQLPSNWKNDRNRSAPFAELCHKQILNLK